MTSLNQTSYFSTPAPSLDPTLFEGRQLRSWVRQGVVQALNESLGKEYRHPELWAHPWLAGSGISYQWQATRNPGDLDCLVGIDFIQFRKANPEYRGLVDKEISDQLNEFLRSDLWPSTSNWNGFELTFYALTTDDITRIKPYAAYDLKYDEWTVTPSPTQQAPRNPEWDSIALSDYGKAKQAYNRATKALQDIGMSHNGPQQVNSHTAMNNAYAQASAIFDEIHGNRSLAFSPVGQGYEDFNNYRWQAGKRSGAIELLREIKSAVEGHIKADNQAKYGVDLPDASTLIRRAALYRSN
jgi:hypothetical protein